MASPPLRKEVLESSSAPAVRRNTVALSPSVVPGRMLSPSFSSGPAGRGSRALPGLQLSSPANRGRKLSLVKAEKRTTSRRRPAPAPQSRGGRKQNLERGRRRKLRRRRRRSWRRSALERLDQGLAEPRRRRGDADARSLHRRDLALGVALAARDNRP